MATDGICIVTTRIGKAGFTPLLNLIGALSTSTTKLIVLSSHNFEEFFDKLNLSYKGLVEIAPIGKKNEESTFISLVRHLAVQLKIAIKLVSKRKYYDIVIFFIGGEKMLLPIAISKVLGKKTVILLAGSEKDVEIVKNKSLGYLVGFISKIIKKLSDRIFLYSPNLVRVWRLYEHTHKISFAYEHWLKVRKKKENILTRKYIGFVGRLGAEKGIDKFLKSVEILEQSDPHFKYSFIVAGDGDLRDITEAFAEKLKKLEYLGWVDKNKLNNLLCQLRFVVLPSHTEGLPNIVLEAMACKTPALVTSVGSIPDLISNEKTGFIIHSNDPVMLSKTIEHLAYEPAKLRKAGHNGYILIKNKFNKNTVSERWRKALYSLCRENIENKEFKEHNLGGKIKCK